MLEWALGSLGALFLGIIFIVVAPKFPEDSKSTLMSPGDFFRLIGYFLIFATFAIFIAGLVITSSPGPGIL